MSLTREQILQVDDIKTEIVPVPEWDGEVIVRTMTGTDRDIWDNLLYKEGKVNFLDNTRARLLACTIIDEDDNLVFSEDDIVALGKKSSLAINRIFDVAKRLNGLGSEQIEDLEKNSEETQGEDSISD
ncbi:hypothetical protein LCGC14_1197440 [marine sediment metagenome]|uniref:Tail assembly chaperone n=1 Tax=marine sediment metagenome TaxID=412755 RepID=A0A0F9LMC9_9ZZZZ